MANTVEVVAIGSELLAGLSVNSNAAYLSRKLTELGFQVQRHTVLPDDEDILREGLAESLHCNTLVIATGGLGPTLDDLTKNVAAELFASDLHFNEEIAKELQLRYGKLATLQNQATVPSKAHILKNKLGTAPGFMFSEHKGTLIILPGIPHEMKEMFENEVAPLLKKHFAFEERIFTEELHFGSLYESQVDPELRELKEEFPELRFGLYPREGLLTVQVTGSDPDLLKAATSRISDRFAAHLFLSPSGRIEDAIHALFKQKNSTLAIAESCTGGALSARITSLPGASQFFLGGIIAYANDVKIQQLHVSKELIEKYGAVSKEAASAMAEGVQSVMKSGYSISVTGIAGPDGGSDDKPVGTVFYAIKRGSSPPLVRELRGYGSRSMIIQKTINVVLSELYFSMIA